MASTHVKEDLNTTRQLLDELDALMDQMLALPVHDQEDDAAATVPPAGMTTTLSATLTMLEPPTPEPETDQESAADVQASHSDCEIARTQGDAGPLFDQPAPDVEPVPASVLTQVAAPLPVEHAPLPPKVRSVRRGPGSLGYHFLLWMNRGYDRATSRLGWPGRLLASRFVKSILGLAGLGLLTAALGWLCNDWLGR
jgi:hypothetical protein